MVCGEGALWWLPCGVTAQGAALLGECGTHPGGAGFCLQWGQIPCRGSHFLAAIWALSGTSILRQSLREQGAGVAAGHARVPILSPLPRIQPHLLSAHFLLPPPRPPDAETHVQKSGANGVPEPAGLGVGGAGGGGTSRGVLPHWRWVTG